jgi:Na+/H+ antiporter NhaD/arsenite permease-like protein
MTQHALRLALEILVPGRKTTLVFGLLLCATRALASEEGSGEPGDSHGGEAHHGGVSGASLGLLWAVPFAGILLSIALFPLLAERFWHHHFAKVSAFWALLFAVPYLVSHGADGLHDVLHIYLVDYIPFIILLWALYTVAGGIFVGGSLRGKPGVNTIMLLIGTLLASWIGTTGAAMVLIRPFLRANAWRKKRVHQVVFFIFLVANIGGSLTPLGDPPLFLGFLHGVPFFWVTTGLLKEWAVVSAILLVLFLILDTIAMRGEVEPPDDGNGSGVSVHGLGNLVFLFGIIGGVLFSGSVHMSELNIGGIHVPMQNLIRDGFLILMGICSLTLMKKEWRKKNQFTWFPILEVAYLFAGIFMTIIPALKILQAGADGALAGLVAVVKEPIHYFWITGGLSSFLDNAPTYLTFFNTALGSMHLKESMVPDLLMGAGAATEQGQTFTGYLTAISAGAVFMGANTYIGNAPNFMVKSIAEESDVAMPSFFGYMFRYSIPILIPVFAVITLIFFL